MKGKEGGFLVSRGREGGRTEQEGREGSEGEKGSSEFKRVEGSRGVEGEIGPPSPRLWRAGVYEQVYEYEEERGID